MMRCAISIVTVVLVISSASSTAAQESSPSREDQGRAAELTRRALVHYEAGEAEEAVALLLEARRLYREPVLLYNLARAYEALGRDEEALAAYEQYVEERPDAPDSAAMQAHIESLRAHIAERERLAEERAAERRRRRVAERRADEAGGSGPWPWVLVGAGGAGLGAGLVVGVVAKSERDNAAADPVHETTLDTMARAESMATAANVLFAAGGGLVVTGAIWLIVDALTGGGGAPDDFDAALGPNGVLVTGNF